MRARSRGAQRWGRIWRTVKDSAFGAAAVLSAHWLLQPAFERAAARWGVWPVALTAGGAAVLGCALFAAWFIGLPQRRARRRSGAVDASEYAALRRRRWLAGALGTLIAAALGKWVFIHAGDALVDRLGFWPGMAVAFGVPFAAFVLAALVVGLVLRRYAKTAYGRNAAHVDRAVREPARTERSVR
jgi:hypothetical protein